MRVVPPGLRARPSALFAFGCALALGCSQAVPPDAPPRAVPQAKAAAAPKFPHREPRHEWLSLEAGLAAAAQQDRPLLVVSVVGDMFRRC